MNTQVTVRRIEFFIEDEITHCNLFYTSTEPGNPAWGGGYKTKSFPASKSIVDFINEEVPDYLLWPNGRYESKH